MFKKKFKCYWFKHYIRSEWRGCCRNCRWFILGRLGNRQ